jgi:GAF domain-containing protein
MSANLAAAERWLLSRVDQRCRTAMDEVFQTIAEYVAIATADAVTIRRLTDDGQNLVPVAVYDGDQHRAAAMSSIMWQTQRIDEGLWQPVMENRAPLRWHIPSGSSVSHASDEQSSFVHRFGIRAILGMPLINSHELVGGMSLVRFGIDRPFDEADEKLMTLCGQRLAPALAFYANCSEGRTS